MRYSSLGPLIVEVQGPPSTEILSAAVSLNLEVFQYWPSQKERCVSWDHKHLKSTKQSTDVERKVDGPFGTTAGISSELKGLVKRSEGDMS